MNNVSNVLNNNYYARWLRDDEMLATHQVVSYGLGDTIEKSGLPIGCIEEKMVVDTSECHNLIIGSTGSGKTQTIVLPMLYMASQAGESVIVKDIKGELYTATGSYFKDAGYKVIALDFSEPVKGNCFNPLTLVYKLYKNGKKDEALNLLEEIARTIMHENSTADPFWEYSAAAYFTGLTLALIDNVKEDEVNLNSVGYLTTLGDDELLDEFISKLDKNSTIYKTLASVYLAPPETKNSILSVLNQKLAFFTNRENLSSLLSKTDFDIINFNEDKYAIYLITSNESRQADILSNIFIQEIYYVMMSSRREKYANIILDGFDEVRYPINKLSNILDNSRGNKVRFTLLVKGFLNLKETYGIEELELIKYNCANILYLLSSEKETLEFISDYCGNKDDDSKLVSVEALKRMEIWSCILMKSRLMPYASKLAPFYQIGIEPKERLELKPRKKTEVKIFDLNKFLSKK